MNYSGEFIDQLQATILNGIYQQLSNTHTNLIAKVTKVNKATINVKPVVNRVVNEKSIELPEFQEIIPINLRGGSSYIQMPIEVGDYCELMVNERCIDNWYYGKDFTKPIIPRMHDYSDSVALVGLHNKNGELTIPDRIKMNGDCLQLGDYEHQGNREQTGNYTLNGNQTINSGTLTIPSTSDLRIDDGSGNVISLRDFLFHYHSQGSDSNGDSEVDTGTPTIPSGA